MTTITGYKMNPAEDDLLFGTQLREDMWVLPERPEIRRLHGKSEDDKIRRQRFRQVTQLQHVGDQVVFIGKWVDGYAEIHRYHATFYGWLVKRENSAPAEAELAIRAALEGLETKESEQ